MVQNDPVNIRQEVQILAFCLNGPTDVDIIFEIRSSTLPYFSRTFSFGKDNQLPTFFFKDVPPGHYFFIASNGDGRIISQNEMLVEKGITFFSIRIKVTRNVVSSCIASPLLRR